MVKIWNKVIFGKKRVNCVKEYHDFIVDMKKGRHNSNSIVLVFSALIILYIMGSVFYSIYLFIEITKVSDKTGIHVVTPVKKAVKNILGQDQESNFYKGDLLELQYPRDWELKQANFVILRKYNKQQLENFESLAASVSTGEIANPKNFSLEKLLKENKRSLGKNIAVQVGGKKGVRTGEVVSKNHPTTDTIYWEEKGRVVFLEAAYYNKNNTELRNDFEKIIATVKF